MLYFDPKYEYSIIPWVGYLEIFFHYELLFLVIRLSFRRILRPFFPIKIKVTLTLYLEINLTPPLRKTLRYHSR